MPLLSLPLSWPSWPPEKKTSRSLDCPRQRLERPARGGRGRLPRVGARSACAGRAPRWRSGRCWGPYGSPARLCWVGCWGRGLSRARHTRPGTFCIGP
eukprot:11905015-Alexandrium_andersonii.AAC.1